MVRQKNLQRLVNSYPTQQDFATLVGVSVQYINQLLSGHRNIGEKTARKFERAAKLEIGHLDRTELHTPTLYEHSNVSPAPPLRGMVPVISWVSAGRWREPDVTLDAPLDWIPHIGATPNTFALRVEGDSMEPNYPPGTYLIVDPDRAPEPMNLVIALNGDDEATFKRLTREGKTWYLTPLNRQYPSQPLDSLCKIIGIVIWSGRREV